MESLNIRVEKVIYPNEVEDRAKRDAGERKLFYILSVATDTGIGTKAKGELSFRPRENERLTLKGDWTVYNGTRQFKWQDATADIPVDERSMLRYACELTSGIGPKFEEAIWEMYGEKWRDIEPGKIKGLTMAKVDALHDTIQELETKAERSATIAFLLEHHLTLNMANAAFDKWGRNTVPTVRGNCYALCDLPNYGFRDIDADIRQTFGIQDGDPRRVMAAIVYCMRLLTERGDTVVPWYLLFGQLKEKLGRAVPDGFIMDNLQASVMAGNIRYFMLTQMVSLAADYAAEEVIWNFAEARA